MFFNNSTTNRYEEDYYLVVGSSTLTGNYLGEIQLREYIPERIVAVGSLYEVRLVFGLELNRRMRENVGEAWLPLPISKRSTFYAEFWVCNGLFIAVVNKYHKPSNYSPNLHTGLRPSSSKWHVEPDLSPSTVKLEHEARRNYHAIMRQRNVSKRDNKVKFLRNGHPTYCNGRDLRGEYGQKWDSQNIFDKSYREDD